MVNLPCCECMTNVLLVTTTLHPGLLIQRRIWILFQLRIAYVQDQPYQSAVGFDEVFLFSCNSFFNVSTNLANASAVFSRKYTYLPFVCSYINSIPYQMHSTPNLRRPACFKMVVAVVLATSRRQGISSHHTYSTAFEAKGYSGFKVSSGTFKDPARWLGPFSRNDITCALASQIASNLSVFARNLFKLTITNLRRALCEGSSSVTSHHGYRKYPARKGPRNCVQIISIVSPWKIFRSISSFGDGNITGFHSIYLAFIQGHI